MCLTQRTHTGLYRHNVHILASIDIMYTYCRTQRTHTGLYRHNQKHTNIYNTMINLAFTELMLIPGARMPNVDVLVLGVTWIYNARIEWIMHIP